MHEPLGGASVMVSGSKRVIITGNMGDFSWVLPVGEYTVTITAHNHLTRTKLIHIVEV